MAYQLPEEFEGKFTEPISLKHGRSENREWWEWWKGKIGIVVQRILPDPYFLIFFIDGDVIRMLGYEGRENEYPIFESIEEAIKALQSVGIEVRSFERPLEVEP